MTITPVGKIRADSKCYVVLRIEYDTNAYWLVIQIDCDAWEHFCTLPDLGSVIMIDLSHPPTP
jgi:hypothetical protein